MRVCVRNHLLYWWSSTPIFNYGRVRYAQFVLFWQTTELDQIIKIIYQKIIYKIMYIWVCCEKSLLIYLFSHQLLTEKIIFSLFFSYPMQYQVLAFSLKKNCPSGPLSISSYSIHCNHLQEHIQDFEVSRAKFKK